MNETAVPNKWASRKFIFSTATVVLASGMCIGGFVDAETWKLVVIAVVGGYLAANVIQKATVKPGASTTA